MRGFFYGKIMAWGILFLIMAGAAGIGGILYIKYSEKKKQEIWEAEQAKLQEEQRQKELKRAERAAAAATAEAKKFETIEGFLCERDICMNHAKLTADSYVESLKNGNRSLDSRRRHLIWESLYLILQSTNAKTIKSRIGVMCRNLQAMKWPHIPIGQKELKIASTHYYYVQIQNLVENIDNYKTEPAKEKAAIRINELFQEAEQEEMVYQQALNDFRQKLQA